MAFATTVLSMVIMNALTATTASAHRYRPRVTSACGVRPAGAGKSAASPYTLSSLLLLLVGISLLGPDSRAAAAQLSHQATMDTPESCHHRDKEPGRKVGWMRIVGAAP
ncbi:hypothetical protein [Actinomadura decatromicini]|uniref:hypothetical protein n=1 Tax=Actinomadura decatromicini TaxID=2604572 RepID=UPI001652C272|nr:hypothetical protein [Actinomadura decatromicini]